MSPLTLAYIGDTIYDLIVRSYLVMVHPTTVHQLHHKATEFVNASAQSDTLNEIIERLTKDERNMVRRGRNAKSGTVPKNADIGDYRRATGLEALLGYLFLSGRIERLTEIAGWILNNKTNKKTK
jgi:ribonuclease-3 family protein